MTEEEFNASVHEQVRQELARLEGQRKRGLESRVAQLEQTLDSLDRLLSPIISFWNTGRAAGRLLFWIGGAISGLIFLWSQVGDFIKAHIR